METHPSIGITRHGESYRSILGYFLPELVTTFLLYSMPLLLDIYFISHLKSTSTYTALGTTGNFIHFLVKVAEAMSVSTMVVAGRFNGTQDHGKVGKTLKDSLIVSVAMGLGIGVLLYVGAPFLLRWYGAHEQVIPLAVPFLRLRSISVSLMFIFFGLIGFMRGIKNTRTPMLLFIVGVAAFIGCDYLLIFGKYGFPALGLQGSAYASIIQYTIMTVAAVAWVLLSKTCAPYRKELLQTSLTFSYVKDLCMLAWPIACDKATIAFAYIWLGKMICSMGFCAQTTLCAIRDIERFALVPGLAFAQIITFLTSNDLGKKNWASIIENTKKVLILSAVGIGSLLLIFYFFLDRIIYFFDNTNSISSLMLTLFPIVCVLIFFDLLQLILSGTLRGSGNVKSVMAVRLFVCLCYFGPVSYLLTMLPLQGTTQFVLIYGSFYIGHAIMALMYIQRMRSDDWKS